MSKPEKAPTSIDLAIPVYIDVSAILDLLASIEDGFSLVERVTTRSTANDATERSIRGEIGASSVISNLLKVNLDAARTKKQTDEMGEERQADRFHTYGSLLHRLRLFLADRELLKKDISDWEAVHPSDFVELRGVFQTNPFVDWLDTTDRMIEIFNLAAAFQPIPAGSVGNSQNKNRAKQNALPNQLNDIRKFFKGLRADIEPEDIRTFVISLADSSYKAVISLFIEYLRDKSMAELAHGEFTVLGKVTRNFTKASGGTIDLLSGTGLGGVGSKPLGELLQAFNLLSNNEDIKLPTIETKIPAPVLQVVPVAIYV